MCFEAVPYLENCDRFWTLLIYHAFYYFGNCCWTLTDNILCFLFPFSLTCKFLFAYLCNVLFFATFWTLLHHEFYFLALAVGLTLTDNMGGGGGGGWLITSYVSFFFHFSPLIPFCISLYQFVLLPLSLLADLCSPSFAFSHVFLFFSVLSLSLSLSEISVGL